MKFAISVHLSVIYASWKQEKREREEKQYNHKMMNGHISKIARMLRRDVDVDQHILKISSNQLTFNRSLYCAEDQVRYFSTPNICYGGPSQLGKDLLATWNSATLHSSSIYCTKLYRTEMPKTTESTTNYWDQSTIYLSTFSQSNVWGSHDRDLPKRPSSSKDFRWFSEDFRT